MPGVLTTTERVKAALRIPAGVTYQDGRIGQIVEEVEGEFLELVELDAFVSTTYTATMSGGRWNGSMVFLPKFPVLSVVALTVHGSALGADDFSWDRSGCIRLVESFAPSVFAVEATYTAGLVAVAGTTSADLIRIATLMACRQYNVEGMAGLLDMEVDPVKKQVARIGFGEDAVDTEIQRLLARYRRPAG